MNQQYAVTNTTQYNLELMLASESYIFNIISYFNLTEWCFFVVVAVVVDFRNDAIGGKFTNRFELFVFIFNSDTVHFASL